MNVPHMRGTFIHGMGLLHTCEKIHVHVHETFIYLNQIQIHLKIIISLSLYNVIVRYIERGLC